MSKTPTAVFKATRPDLIDAYDQRTTELWGEYRAKLKVLEQEWGVTQLLCRDDRNGGQFITGYVPASHKDEPMTGFRKDRDSGYMVPDRRTAEGKAVVQRLKDVHYAPGKKPGLPSTVLGQGYMGPFTLRKLGGVWYAVLTVPLGSPEERGSSLREVDRDVWEPAKLSEYFLAVEAEEEAL